MSATSANSANRATDLGDTAPAGTPTCATRPTPEGVGARVSGGRVASGGAVSACAGSGAAAAAATSAAAATARATKAAPRKIEAIAKAAPRRIHVAASTMHLCMQVVIAAGQDQMCLDALDRLEHRRAVGPCDGNGVAAAVVRVVRGDDGTAHQQQGLVVLLLHYADLQDQMNYVSALSPSILPCPSAAKNHATL